MKLLIVEDDYITLEGIINVVRWDELGVTELEKAVDGMEAVEIAQRFHPSIVLSDIRMPRMDGIAFAVALREFEPECKIIFMSAYTDREYYKEAIKLKAVSFIEKPIDVSELEQAIGNAVAQRKEEMEKAVNSDEMHQALHTSIPLIKNELAALLINKDADEPKIRQMLKLLAVDIQEGSDFATIIAEIQDDPSDETSLDKEMRSNMLGSIEEIISMSGYGGIVGFRGGNEMLIHVFTLPNKKCPITLASLENLCMTIYETLSDNGLVSVVAGKVVRGIANLYQSYNTAMLAQQKSFYQQSCPCHCYTADNTEALPLDKKTMDLFSDYLSRKGRGNLIGMVKQLSRELRQHTNTPVNSVKVFYYLMIMNLVKAAEADGIQFPDSRNGEGFLWETVSKIHFLTKLEECVISRIETYFNLLEEKNKYSPTVTGILNYIHAHYHEQTLSTKDISEHVFLSSAYICVLFKQETGETISSYITKFRMEISKKLLADMSLKVADIARCVGYEEGDYFAKLFRKFEGLSPSEYRERL